MVFPKTQKKRTVFKIANLWFRNLIIYGLDNKNLWFSAYDRMQGDTKIYDLIRNCTSVYQNIRAYANVCENMRPHTQPVPKRNPTHTQTVPNADPNCTQAQAETDFFDVAAQICDLSHFDGASIHLPFNPTKCV